MKVSDFGLAKFTMPDDLMSDTCGTPAYIAPEILNKNGYGKEIDIWSSGCVLYYMVTGLLPFMNNNREIALNMIKEQDPDYENYKFRIFSKESKKFRDLIRAKGTLNGCNRCGYLKPKER